MERRVRKRWLAVLLSSCLSLVGAEFAIRYLLFSDDALALRLGAGLRDANLYSHWQSADAWWLKARFGDGRASQPHPEAHALLGWAKAGLDPDAPPPVDPTRRPVLLYGDSFAACATPSEDCWEGLLERSPLGAELELVNLGVGGYGIGQIELMLRHTLERYADRDPIVVVAILVDDDLDRSDLGLRGFPKPRYDVRGGALHLQTHDQSTALEYVDAHPLGVTSYLARIAVHAKWVPARVRGCLTGEARRVERIADRTRLLVEAMVRELEARDLEHFFVLFHGPKALYEIGPFGWREELLVTLWETNGIPYVSSKRALLEDSLTSGKGRDDYFIPTGFGRNHYTPEGNRAVFRALERGLGGEFEPPGYLVDAPPHWRVRD